MSFLLVCLTRVWSCSYVSWRNQSYVVMGRKCLCVDWFYLGKWFARAWAKKFAFKKGGLALGRCYPFEEKRLNTHGREKNKAWWVKIDFIRRMNIRPKAKCLPRFRIFGEASGVYPSFPFSSAPKKIVFIIFVLLRIWLKDKYFERDRDGDLAFRIQGSVGCLPKFSILVGW